MFKLSEQCMAHRNAHQMFAMKVFLLFARVDVKFYIYLFQS